MVAKPAHQSLTIMTEAVLPNDTNILGNLLGGRLLYLMDMAAAISAAKHSNRIAVTAAVDSVSFAHPIKLGDVLTIKAYVTRAFRTSMEVYLEVWGENIPARTRYKSNEAYYTFVALDEHNRPVPVPEVIPETDEEKKQYEGALRRRELRLILSGRMKPEEAHELKELFFNRP